jgi:hypothetical protein
MTEATGTPIPPPTASPQKTNTWIIAIVVIVVVCCGCFGVIGLILTFWEPIRQALGMSSLLPSLMILL